MEEVVLTGTFCVGVTEVLVLTEKHQEKTKNANHPVVSPQWWRYKSNTLIPPRKLRVDCANNLVTFCYLGRQISPTLCYRGRLHLKAPERLFQAPPSPIITHPYERCHMCCVACWPLCYQSGTTPGSRSFIYRTLPHGHMYFVNSLYVLRP